MLSVSAVAARRAHGPTGAARNGAGVGKPVWAMLAPRAYAMTRVARTRCKRRASCRAWLRYRLRSRRYSPVTDVCRIPVSRLAPCHFLLVTRFRFVAALDATSVVDPFPRQSTVLSVSRLKSSSPFSSIAISTPEFATSPPPVMSVKGTLVAYSLLYLPCIRCILVPELPLYFGLTDGVLSRVRRCVDPSIPTFLDI